jgi:DNA-directed RNA polymerase subunit M/transcription elongation factor TFIIS
MKQGLHEGEKRQMDRGFTPTKSCPKCGSVEYMFRSRKKVALEPGQGAEAAVETKYRCKACGHEWRVRTPASA